MAAFTSARSQMAFCASHRASPAALLAGAVPSQPVAAVRRQVVVPKQQRLSLQRCRAGKGEQQPDPEQQPEQQQQQQPPAVVNKRPAAEDPQVAKGQRTAVVTGVISIMFGVIYLGLVSFMDMRGGEMLPPPPEAYLP